MSRYNYNSNRRRTFSNKPKSSNSISLFIFLIFSTLALFIWVLKLKSDISNISDFNQELKFENDSLRRLVLIKNKPIIKEIIIETKPKKVYKKKIKDTTKLDLTIVKPEIVTIKDSSEMLK